METARELLVSAAIDGKIQILPQGVFTLIDKVNAKTDAGIHYDNIAVIKDIPYAMESPMQKGDLYGTPKLFQSEEKIPLIFNIHGGSFIEGDKSIRAGISSAWANAGYYVYSINYRKAPEVDMLGLLKDCGTAWNYLPDLAKNYNIDLNRLIITGDSSGTFCAAFLTAIAFNDSLRNEVGFPGIPVKPAAAMFHGGFYDMDRFLKLKMPFDVVPDLVSLICKFVVKRNLSNVKDYPHYAALSPIKYVNPDWCPSFVSWSNADFIVPGQGAPMAQALLDNNVPTESMSVTGKEYGHCFHLDVTSEAGHQCLEESLSFLDANLKGGNS